MFKGGLGDIMKQAQAMQGEMQKAQEALANLKVVGESGGGMVKITMTGKHEARGIKIDDSLIGDDRDMLEDLIAAAINDASRKIEAQTKDKMSGMLPAGMKMPF